MIFHTLCCQLFIVCQFYCVLGIVVLGINRPQSKNAISKNLVTMVSIFTLLVKVEWYLITIGYYMSI